MMRVRRDDGRVVLKVVITTVVSAVLFVLVRHAIVHELGVLVMNWYCDAKQEHEWHQPYHDEVYGFPVDSDDVLFERLVLELNQAGLSWLLILRKTEAFRRAFCDFQVAAGRKVRR